MGSEKVLLFVYNADSDLISTVKDYFHKAFRPDTYQCNLCAVTFGPLGKDRSWKNFTENLEIPVKFLHRDEFHQNFDVPDAKFPSAYLKESDDLKIFITKEEMNNVSEITELKNLVNRKLDEFNI